MDRRGFLLGASAAGLATVGGGGLLSCSSGGSGSRAAGPVSAARTAAAAVRRYGDVELIRRQPASDAPNVLFLSIDDCNDWVGFLNPHPGTLTPNLDALASRSVSFDHAYAAAPMCGPARTAITFGTHPFENDVYDHSAPSNKAYAALRKGTPSLVDDFWAAGYETLGAGKIYHLQLPERWDEYRSTKWYIPGYQRKVAGADPATFDPDWLSPYDGQPIADGRKFGVDMIDFGPSGVSADQEPDGQAARWIQQRLQGARREPFFLGFGNYIPHEPWRVPKKFFDMHPLEAVVAPKIRPDDLDDLGAYARDEIVDPLHIYERLVASGLWERAVQAYQAAISFADDRIGIVLDELASSRYADNTIVVVWSDHGFHLGEKLHISKFTLWERATRVPLLIHQPGRFDRQQRVAPPVSTIDLGPTLADLCGVATRTPFVGSSLLPIIDDPGLADERPPVTTWQQGNHAVRRRQWRYIRYRTGETELYDQSRDPDEFDNLARDPQHAPLIAELDAFLPPPN